MTDRGDYEDEVDDAKLPARRPTPRPPANTDRDPRAAQRQSVERDPYDYESIFTEDDSAYQVPIKDRIVAQKLTIARTGTAFVLTIVLLVVGYFGYRQFDPAGSPGLEVLVEIPAGASTASVASLLERNDVIPNALAFRFWTKAKGGVSFQAGEYNFSRNSSAAEAAAVLKAGPKAATDRLTIPEGFRLLQIAERVGRIPGLSSQRFYDLARSGDFRSPYQQSGSNNLEGLLFPNTYLLSSSDTEESLLRRMINELNAQARLTGLDQSERTAGLTAYDTLIIASMIEAEAKTDEDRGKISQVIHNRIANSMRLQIDATVLYALRNNKTTLSNSDLKIDSPYNTYRVDGLPPTPICSPGAESIKAALRPTPGSWLYYVVTEADGSHAFATTLEEHERNVESARDRGIIP